MALWRIDHGLAADAAKALDVIRAASGDQVSTQVITRLKGLPAMIRTSGTLATLAFFAAKGRTAAPGGDGQRSLGEAYAAVGAALRHEVTAALRWPEEPGSPNVDAAFLARVAGAGNSGHGLAVVDARLEAFGGWMRRLAEALEIAQLAGQANRAHAGDAAGAEPTNGGDDA